MAYGILDNLAKEIPVEKQLQDLDRIRKGYPIDPSRLSRYQLWGLIGPDGRITGAAQSILDRYQEAIDEALIPDPGTHTPEVGSELKDIGNEYKRLLVRLSEQTDAAAAMKIQKQLEAMEKEYPWLVSKSQPVQTSQTIAKNVAPTQEPGMVSEDVLPSVSVQPKKKKKSGQRVLSVFSGDNDVSGVKSANKANRRRLNAIMGELAGLGESQGARIDQTARRQLAMNRQSLINRGLGASTILGPMERRINESANLQHIDLADRMRQQRAGVLERVSDSPMPLSALMSNIYQMNRARGLGG